MQGSACHISVGDARTVWAVNAQGSVYKWLGGDQWEQVGGAPANVAQVAVCAGAARVAAVCRPGGAIYAYSPMEGGWSLVPGELSSIAVSEARAEGWGRVRGIHVRRPFDCSAGQ